MKLHSDEPLDHGSLAGVRRIHVSLEHYEQVVSHARRKLAGRYLPGEEREQKAFGLLGADITGARADVTDVFPLWRNERHLSWAAGEFDTAVHRFAVPSETPMERRGWVADPREVLEADKTCAAKGSIVVGSYHTHRVAWNHDPVRDRSTELDQHLAATSGLWMVIVSIVDPCRPRLRAFFEGSHAWEAMVIIE